MRAMTAAGPRPSYRQRRISRKIAAARSFNITANLGRSPLSPLFRLIRYISRRLSSAELLPGFSDAVNRFLKDAEEISDILKYRISSYFEDLRSRERSRLVPIVILVCAAAILISSALLSFGLRVTVNGRYVGYVKSMEDMEKIVVRSEQMISNYTGSPYNINIPITYSLSLFTKRDLIDEEAVEQIILSSVDYLDSKNVYELVVNDKVIGSCESFEVLNMTLFRTACEESGSFAESRLSFTEDVRIRSEKNPAGPLSGLSEITDTLLGDVSGAGEYIVKKGDTVSAIAAANNITISQIQRLNPGLDVDRIDIGQILVISDRVPFLHVKQTVRASYAEEVPFETQIEYTADLYTNESKIIKEGVVGTAAVTADIEYYGDAEIKRTIVTYEVTEEPIMQIKQVGTTPVPIKAATGTFQAPAQGTLTSKFGYRPSMGDTHTGIDIANSTGTPIVAADGGTVTFAGTKGNYGRCVIIDHGNGYVTLYAHNSKLLVTAGQKVAKGEQIARMGMSGWATGPHCHFEIRYEGVVKNPLNYIKLK